MTIHLIVAHGKNREIGYNNQLLWHLPTDLKRFRAITTGHIVVMGRKTFESIGRALPNRTNIVLTRDTSLSLPTDIKTYHSTDSIIRLSKNKEIYIIGGAEVYRAFLPFADRLYITLVNGTFKADSYFPEYDHILDHYTLIDNPTSIQPDPNEEFSYNFLNYQKNDSKKLEITDK